MSKRKTNPERPTAARPIVQKVMVTKAIERVMSDGMEMREQERNYENQPGQ